MRKCIAVSLMAVWAAGLALPGPTVRAQGSGALTLGEWVEGELTETACTTNFTFQANDGDLILVEFLRKTGTMDLDPAMVITDSAGTTVAEADDTLAGFGASAIFEATGGDYTVTIMPSTIYFNNIFSDVPVADWDMTCPSDAAYGEYMLRASIPELLVPGSTATATIYAAYEMEGSSVFVLHPDAAVTWGIHFEQPASELRAGIDLMKMPDEETIFSLTDTLNTRSGTLNVDLEAGQIYFLVVSKSFYSYPFDETLTTDVTMSVSEAQ